MTSNLFCILHSIRGDLLFFDIREQCMEEWENKLKEMEMEGIWETVTKGKLYCQWTTMIRQTRLCLSSCEKY